MYRNQLTVPEEFEMNIRPEICYFGQVRERDYQKPFGILQEDRRRHFYIVGKTGMGKSTLLENMILQDINNGHGVCFLDPHGDSVEFIMDRIPPERRDDVVYFNPADTDNPIGLNVLEAAEDEDVFLVASGLMAIFQRVWEGMWSSRMEYIVNNTMLALLEVPGNTLLSIVRMLTDTDFREKIVKQVGDPMVRNFWQKEFTSFNERYRTEAIAPILNKIGQFLSTNLIRNILGQTESTINLRDIMDNKKIFLVNLSKGKLGENNSNLLGSLLVTKLQLAAMRRVDIAEQDRSDFYMYVDEFQNFTTDSFATILSEARKYRLNLILAHQYIAQLTETGNQKVKNAVFGNVGSMVLFRVGATDADEFEKEFGPAITAQTLTNLDKTQVAIKMSIDGRGASPFVANTLPPLFDEKAGIFDETVAISRAKYARSRVEVEQEINEWLNNTPDDKKSKRKRKDFNKFAKTKESFHKDQDSWRKKNEQKKLINNSEETENNSLNKLRKLKEGK